jgi:hypothetical protein
LIIVLALYLYTLHSVNSSTLKLEEELLRKQAGLVASLQSGAAEPGIAVTARGAWVDMEMSTRVHLPPLPLLSVQVDAIVVEPDPPHNTHTQPSA